MHPNVGFLCLVGDRKKYNKIKTGVRVFFLAGNIPGIYDRNSTNRIKKYCLLPSMLEKKIKKSQLFFLSGMIQAHWRTRQP